MCLTVRSAGPQGSRMSKVRRIHLSGYKRATQILDMKTGGGERPWFTIAWI